MARNQSIAVRDSERTNPPKMEIGHEKPFRSGRVSSLAAFAFAFLFCAAYMFWYSRRGWLPEDDGLLAQSALRVLQGQLPHRDFVENYTGGLSCLNALAFRLFGVTLVAMRIMSFLVFIAWLPAVFYIAPRVTSAIPSAGIMVLATVWGAPNYPTPMPSWYNMYLAVFGAAVLLRYLETKNRRWLIVAGICGGVSFLVKIIGLYYVAAVLIFFVFREQVLADENNDNVRSTYAYSAFSIVSMAMFLVAVGTLMRHRFGDAEFTQLFLPSAVLTLTVIWRELRLKSKIGNAERFSALFHMLVPFGLGIALPVFAFLCPYIVSGSVRAFVRGVFGGLSPRLQAMGLVRPEHARFLVFPAALVTVIAVAAFWKRTSGALFAILVTLSSTILFLASLRNAELARGIWLSAALSTPLFVIFGASLILFRPSFADNLSAVRQQQVMLLMALAGVCSLVQFPFDAKIYFCYFAPLVVLAAGAVFKSRKRIASPETLACLMALYALFAITRITPMQLYENPLKRAPVEMLILPRAEGLMIPHARVYQSAIETVIRHAGSGPVIATPESPDVYFLSGLRNPTRADGALSSEEILSAIQDQTLKVVVLNTSAAFSESTLTPEILDVVRAKFPYATQIGRYWICWR